MDKNKQIIEACEKVMDGIEDDKITGSSALLLCQKIARLTNDSDAMIWLNYEAGGYKRTKDGKYIDSSAFKIACIHNRGYVENEKQYIFTELISQLENAIDANKISLKSFSTQGASVSGEKAYLAMNRLVGGVQASVSNINSDIKTNSRKRAILMNEYYNYAHKKYISLQFGNYNLGIFNNYQTKVNNYFSTLDKDLLLKLDAIQNAINSDNKENFSQALTTCRKLYDVIAKDLFSKLFPNNPEKKYKTLSGKEIDISGDHTLNQLSAVIETLEKKGADNTIIGSNIIYLVDWLTNINNNQCNGVHNDVTKDIAERCIIQTYISLAGIIDLFLNNKECNETQGDSE